MNFRKNNLTAFFVAICIFIMINAPTIKIFINSEFVNVIALFGLIFFGIIKISLLKFNNQEIVINKFILKILLYFSLLWIIFLSYGLVGKDTNLDLKVLIQYLGIYGFILILLIIVDLKEVHYYLILQLIWSLLLAIQYLTIGIELDQSLGQHYLTIATPFVIGFLILLSNIFLKRNKTSILFSLLGIAILLIPLFSLRGRAPIILSIFILLFYLLLIIVKERRITSKFKYIASGISIIIVLSVIFKNFITEVWIDRIQQMFYSIESEPRYHVYNYFIKKIIENPFGYGLNSAENISNYNYPHNIFLEITLYTGIIGILVFIILIINYFKSINELINNINVTNLAISMISLYLFLTWNISYDLTSSYMPFTAMCLAYILVHNRNHKKVAS